MNRRFQKIFPHMRYFVTLYKVIDKVVYGLSKLLQGKSFNVDSLKSYFTACKFTDKLLITKGK